MGAQPDTYIWPENWLPFQIFLAMETQWRWGPSAPTGLDYKAIPYDEFDVSSESKREVFEAIREMESEALKIFHKEHK